MEYCAFQYTRQHLGTLLAWKEKVDDCTRYTLIRFITTKDETPQNFKVWKTLVGNGVKTKIKTIQTDNGSEYGSKEFQEFTNQAGIHHQFSAPYMHQQNIVAERLNQTIINSSLCILILERSFDLKL
jgi:transposase InsO family protein